MYRCLERAAVAPVISRFTCEYTSRNLTNDVKYLLVCKGEFTSVLHYNDNGEDESTVVILGTGPKN